MFNTQNYLGENKSNYFEGWYFRIAGDNPFSFIAGISKNKLSPHSFIMFVSNTFSHYFKFDISAFTFSKKDMTITIGDNVFSKTQIDVNLTDKDICIKAHIACLNHISFKRSIYAPTAMGPLSYIKMKCNHAVISLKFNASGTIEINKKQTKICGLGYIEKDFGTSFPENYIWAHAIDNNFSIVLAYAYPLALKLKGFICLVLYQGKQYNLSLYTLAKLKITQANKNQFNATLKKGKIKLELNIISTNEGSPLIAPAQNGNMSVQITESLSAVMHGTFTIDRHKHPFSLPAAYEYVKAP